MKLAKEKKRAFFVLLILSKGNFLRIVFYLNVECIEYTFRIYTLLHIKKHSYTFPCFCCLFLKSLKAFNPQFDPSCVFSKNVSSRERVKPWFFLTFNIIISHIFPENFIEIILAVQRIWRFSPSILNIFINFSGFLTFPC